MIKIVYCDAQAWLANKCAHVISLARRVPIGNLERALETAGEFIKNYERSGSLSHFGRASDWQRKFSLAKDKLLQCTSAIAALSTEVRDACFDSAARAFPLSFDPDALGFMQCVTATIRAA